MLELLVAVAFDRVFGEPPTWLHPVVWLGRLTGALERRAPASDAARLAYGAGMVVGVVGCAMSGAWLVCLGASRLPLGLRVLVVGAALKPAFAWRSLEEHAAHVLAPLSGGDLEAARRALSMIVSRPTAELDAARVAAGTIESVAENTSDSVVAPLLWYALGGLPGAWAYRAVNTMDAMIGYRNPQYERLGKAAARLDDALNWLPARVAAGFLVVLAPLAGGDAAVARQMLARDGSATASPNAGRPMAAMAGALGVELEKVGHYVLGRGQRLPGPDDLRRAIRLLRLVSLGAVALAGAARAARYATGMARPAAPQRDAMASGQ